MNIADEVWRQYWKRNIDTIKKKKLKSKSGVQIFEYKYKNKLMRTFIFGRLGVQKERIYETKKIIYFYPMVVCKWKKYINEDPNFWSNGRALKKE